jgi:hypothetical protein
MRISKLVSAAISAALLSIFLPSSAAFASDDRTIDIVELTWNGAPKPSATTQDISSAITNKVSESWKIFTTNEGDTKARNINFIYGKTLESPIRLNSPLSCEGSGFVSFMREIQSETYRRLGIENWRERYLVILAPNAGCIWMGRAQVGTPSAKGGVMILHNTASAFVITHELGHSLGLGHSNFINCGNSQADGAWARECKAVEYGGTIDVMGNVETTSTLSTYHQWRMGLLDPEEIAQSWLNEEITLSSTDVIGGKRAIFIRNNNSTYWIEYRRAKSGVSYKPGLVIYRTDPPPSSAIESPNPEDRLDQPSNPGIGTDIWMMNFDDYQYSMTGRATGSMSLTLGKSGSIAGGNITLTAVQGASEKSVRITIKRTADITPPPAPEIIDPSQWRSPDISIIGPGYDDGESAIAGFEVELNGKAIPIESGSTENFSPTYLNPLTPQKTIYLNSLPEGDFTLAVRATDVWGNKSAWSKSVKAYVDRGKPIVTNDLRISSINPKETKFIWSGLRDEGIGLCSTLFHTPEGFVLYRSTEKSSPSFTIPTGTTLSAQVQVFDCLGNGLKGQIDITPNFTRADKSARTGKWSPASAAYPEGSLRCSGKCSASFSASGNLSALIGQGLAQILVSSKPVVSIPNSTSTTIRTSPTVALGSSKKVIRITGSNFVLAGLAKLDYKTNAFSPISRGQEFPDPSLEDATQRSLSNLGFKIGDFTDDWTVLPMARGTTLLDPTLDLCSGSYPSEKSRIARRQISVTKVGSPYQFLSSETVQYSSAAAALSAFEELKKSYENCVRDKGGTENGVFVSYAFQALPNGVSLIPINTASQQITVRVTIGTGDSARQLFATYQFNGAYFTGLYIVKSGSSALDEKEVIRWIQVASIFSQRLSSANSK